MSKTIQQTIKFNDVSPRELFEIYTDSRKHSAATNSKVSMSRKVGERFSAADGYIKGKNLFVVPNRLIVQHWRGLDWKKADLDSILILAFGKITSGAKIELVHVNVPDHLYNNIKKGWYDFYWNPWKAYIRKSRKK